MGVSSSAPARPARHWLIPALIACAAFAVVVAAIDAAGDYPDAPQGPGLTIDESFNVQEGVRLVEGLKIVGPRMDLGRPDPHASAGLRRLR